MAINENIKSRRKELGLDPLEIAKQMDFTDCSYYDIEDYEDEIYSSIDLKEVKVLCSILKLDLIELLKLDQRLCKKIGSDKSKEICKFSRTELMKNARKKLGLSTSQFGGNVNLSESKVIKLEKESGNFEGLAIFQLDACADGIDVPIEWLLYDSKNGQAPD
ncbi:MAG: hypothetical protein ACQ9MH_14265 [Nitrospinales bacterium]